MREILNLQVGQCGTKLGESFWATISDEHGILPDGSFGGDSDIQLEKVNVYYNEMNNGRFSPRALLIDLEPRNLERDQRGEYAELFNLNTCVYGSHSAGNNWAKGFYTEGTEILEQVLDVVRKEAEACESLQGFQIIHSLGGGTGSGLGSLLMQKIREEFAGRIMHSFPVFPSGKVSDTVVEPYNAVLTMNYLIENCEMVHVSDNEALYNILFRTFKIYTPTYKNLNCLVAQTMSGLTANLRFPSQLNSDLNKYAQNLVPFPRLPFLLTGFIPLSLSGSHNSYWPSMSEMFGRIMEPKVMLADVDPKKGKYISASAMYRSRVSDKEFCQFMTNFRDIRAQYFLQWIPDSIQSSTLAVHQRGMRHSLTFTGNSTTIHGLFDRIRELYTVMFRRRAFIQWYRGEGMEELEFQEAESNMTDLISEYLALECEEVEIEYEIE